jgi:ribonuclease VapC
VSDVVLDASAVLAVLQEESGRELVLDLLHTEGVRISAVNLSEVVTRLAERGDPAPEIRFAVERLPLVTVPFESEDAYQAGLLRPLTRAAGLSFGDRACLALAQRLGLPAVTADRGWTALQLPVTVQVIR